MMGWRNQTPPDTVEKPMTRRQKLQQRREWLKESLEEADEALAAFEKYPELEDVMACVDKILGGYFV